MSLKLASSPARSLSLALLSLSLSLSLSLYVYRERERVGDWGPRHLGPGRERDREYDNDAGVC